MIRDPVEALAPGIALVAPSSIAPIPTVIPTLPEYEEVGDTGHRTLWVAFVVMLVSIIVFVGLAWNVPISKRIFHVITTFIVTFAALSYFALANNHGIGYHHIVERQHNKHGVPDTTKDIYRQVFWARYVEWAITTPLLLLDLFLLAGVNGGNILIAIVADVIMVLTGLFASFGAEDTPQKWGWFTIACIAYLVVVWQLAYHGGTRALAKGNKVGHFFTAIAGFTLVVWTVYPIVWGVAEGARKMSVDEEVVAFAVLDILAKPVFGAWLLFTHASIPETNIELGGFWSEGLSREGQIRIGGDDEGA